MTIFDSAIYADRRKTLIKQMEKGVAIIPTACEQTRNSDMVFPFRPDSYFDYLTGFHEPDALLVVIAGDNPRSILFCQEKDPELEMWTGYRLGPENAQPDLLFDEAYPFVLLDEKILDLLRIETVYFPFGENDAWDQRFFGWIKKGREVKKRSDESILHKICDIRLILDEMRLIKAPEEIDIMRRVCNISAITHENIMKVCKPEMNEREIAASITQQFCSQGGDPLNAYPSIVAGGENACTLHYIKNDCVLRHGDLILIDAGCELHGYAADITRTFPVNGQFSEEQKILYEIVLAAQEAAIEQVQPGKTIEDPNGAAVNIIIKGLIDLGLLEASTEQSDQIENVKRFFTHRTSHWLGMDVHDVGEYKINGEWRTLQPGMVLTIEPGIYIPSHMENVDEKWWGIGIRIEDDILVTEDGCEVLTSDVPKTVKDIEDVMNM